MPFTNPGFDICLSIILLIISYLIGAIPFGILVGKTISHKDLREYGSKNIGSTNAIRVLGRKVGALVFILDCFKGACIIILVKLLNHYNVWTSPIDVIYYGAAAVVGHAYPIYLDFKGGKAVAASLGILFALFPLSAITCLTAFVISLLIWGFVSVSSTFASAAGSITLLILYFVGSGNGILQKPSLTQVIVVFVLVGLILYKHKANYYRLIHKTENSFKKKKVVIQNN